MLTADSQGWWRQVSTNLSSQEPQYTFAPTHCLPRDVGCCHNDRKSKVLGIQWLPRSSTWNKVITEVWDSVSEEFFSYRMGSFTWAGGAIQTLEGSEFSLQEPVDLSIPAPPGTSVQHLYTRSHPPYCYPNCPLLYSAWSWAAMPAPAGLMWQELWSHKPVGFEFHV